MPGRGTVGKLGVGGLDLASNASIIYLATLDLAFCTPSPASTSERWTTDEILDTKASWDVYLDA